MGMQKKKRKSISNAGMGKLKETGSICLNRPADVLWKDIQLLKRHLLIKEDNKFAADYIKGQIKQNEYIWKLTGLLQSGKVKVVVVS